MKHMQIANFLKIQYPQAGLDSLVVSQIFCRRHVTGLFAYLTEETIRKLSIMQRTTFWWKINFFIKMLVFQV